MGKVGFYEKATHRVDTVEGLGGEKGDSSSSSFFHPRSRRGSRNFAIDGEKGNFKKKEKSEREIDREGRKRRAHFRRDAQRDYLRPAIAFAGGTKRRAADAHLIRNRGIVCA